MIRPPTALLEAQIIIICPLIVKINILLIIIKEILVPDIKINLLIMEIINNNNNNNMVINKKITIKIHINNLTTVSNQVL